MAGPGKGLYRHHKQKQRCQTPARMEKMWVRRFYGRKHPDPVLPDLSVKGTGTARSEPVRSKRRGFARRITSYALGWLMKKMGPK